MKLTENFTLAEMTRSATARRLKMDNTPTGEALENLRQTALMLERIRADIQAPIVVTSGYRAPLVNDAVGGRRTSDHTTGNAADIVAPKFGTPKQLAERIAQKIDSLGVAQVIYECIGGKMWVHVSRDEPVRRINKIITINDKGTFPGIV